MQTRASLDLDGKPTVEVLKELVAEGQHLLREELRLVKLEIHEDLHRSKAVARDGGLASVAGHTALLLLAATLVLALAEVMPAWVAGLIVTAVFGGVAAVFGLRAKKNVQEIKPQDATRKVKEDTQWMRDRMHDMKSRAPVSA